MFLQLCNFILSPVSSSCVKLPLKLLELRLIALSFIICYLVPDAVNVEGVICQYYYTAVQSTHVQTSKYRCWAMLVVLLTPGHGFCPLANKDSSYLVYNLMFLHSCYVVRPTAGDQLPSPTCSLIGQSEPILSPYWLRATLLCSHWL